ncbi:MAG: hypothetical protein R3D56_15105 [Paracoccaceae bacterium]
MTPCALTLILAVLRRDARPGCRMTISSGSAMFHVVSERLEVLQALVRSESGDCIWFPATVWSRWERHVLDSAQTLL